MRISLIALIYLTLLSFPLSAQERIETYGAVEITLKSDALYAHPFFDVELNGRFIAPDGEVRRVGGFWDGGKIWVLRFAPDQAGTWYWESECSDPENVGLATASGSFEVLPYSGDDPYRKRGWPRVSENGRHLTYGDGTPFFYLACTAWEMSWRSYSHETDRYFSDRRAKGYNGVQMVVLSHRQFQEFGVVNRNGDSSLIGWDLGMLNPAYFRYLDSLIRKANDSGLLVTLVPLWAELAWIQDKGGHRFTFTREEAHSLARYCAARYGAYNVLWIVAGDSKYGLPEQQEFWSEFATILDTVGGGEHLITVHTSGWDASWNYFGGDVPWLDFHTYHSSHLADNDYQWLAPGEGYPLEPAKPIANGEQVYEDIYNNFHPDSTRIDRRYVRQAAWESFLSGAYVGCIYGANSIWQWHNGTYAFEAHLPRVDVLEAIDFPGSNDPPVLKRVVERFTWHRLEPRLDLVLEKGEGRYVPLSVADSLGLAYFWYNVGPATFNFTPLGDTVELGWISPVTGVESRGDIVVGDQRASVEISPPDTTDWVLVARGRKQVDLPPPPDSTEVVDTLDQVASSLQVQVAVSRRSIRLLGRLRSGGGLRIELVDPLGRRVYLWEGAVPAGALEREISLVASGLYFLTLDVDSGGEDDLHIVKKLALP